MLDISDVLRAISDDKSLALFNMIAVALPLDSQDVMSRLGLTRRQYYSRMAQLTNAGLVGRRNGQHLLTSLGSVVYESHMLIGYAVENYWRLKAIDSVEESNAENYEREMMINALIESSGIKRILQNTNNP